MKRSPPSSPSAAGARAYQKNRCCAMKRKAAVASARPSARVALGGLRLRHICAQGVTEWAPSMIRGVPARAPSMVGGIRLGPGRGRGRGADGLPVELKRGRGGQGRNPGPRGDVNPGGGDGGDEDGPVHGGGGVEDPGRGGGGEHPGAGAGGEDCPGVGGGALEDPTNINVAAVEGPHKDGEDYGEAVEDNPSLYQPYLSVIGEKQNNKEVIDLNRTLGWTFGQQLDNYIAIYTAISKKWKLKRNLNNDPWEQVRLQVKEFDRELDTLLQVYKNNEKYSVELKNQIQSLDGEPLQPPPMLGRHPSQYDSRKEKRRNLRNQKREEKMMERKRLRKEVKAKQKEAESCVVAGTGSKTREKKCKRKVTEAEEKARARKNKLKDKQKHKKEGADSHSGKKAKSGKKRV